MPLLPTGLLQGTPRRISLLAAVKHWVLSTRHRHSSVLPEGLNYKGLLSHCLEEQVLLETAGGFGWQGFLGLSLLGLGFFQSSHSTVQELGG